MASATFIVVTATSPTRWSLSCFCPPSGKCEKVSESIRFGTMLNVSVLAGGCKDRAKYAFYFLGVGSGYYVMGKYIN